MFKASLIHRIDRPTSGVVVSLILASKSLSRMNHHLENFFQKTYWAIVSKVPPKNQRYLKIT